MNVEKIAAICFPLYLCPRLKWIATILFILSMLGQTFSKWVIIASYQFNKGYIAANLCENRTKPRSCCRGKCYLNKQLSKDEQGQQLPARGGQKEESGSQFFPQQNIEISFSSIGLTTRPVPHYLQGKSQDFSSSFFQPPRPAFALSLRS